jgi:hypothetical protein
MSLRSLEHLDHLISENRSRINRISAELAAEGASASTLRLKVIQQMELSLKSLERHRDALASRVATGGLTGHGA